MFGPDHIQTLRLRYYIADLHGGTGHRREAAGRMRDLHNDVHRLADRGQTEVREIREWIELWSAESRRSGTARPPASARRPPGAHSHPGSRSLGRRQ